MKIHCVLRVLAVSTVGTMVLGGSVAQADIVSLDPEVLAIQAFDFKRQLTYDAATQLTATTVSGAPSSVAINKFDTSLGTLVRVSLQLKSMQLASGGANSSSLTSTYNLGGDYLAPSNVANLNIKYTAGATLSFGLNFGSGSDLTLVSSSFSDSYTPFTPPSSVATRAFLYKHSAPSVAGGETTIVDPTVLAYFVGNAGDMLTLDSKFESLSSAMKSSPSQPLVFGNTQYSGQIAATTFSGTEHGELEIIYTYDKSIVPPDSTPVPLPASVWGGLGLLGLAVATHIRRRRSE